MNAHTKEFNQSAFNFDLSKRKVVELTKLRSQLLVLYFGLCFRSIFCSESRSVWSVLFSRVAEFDLFTFKNRKWNFVK